MSSDRGLQGGCLDFFRCFLLVSFSITMITCQGLPSTDDFEDPILLGHMSWKEGCLDGRDILFLFQACLGHTVPFPKKTCKDV